MNRSSWRRWNGTSSCLDQSRLIRRVDHMRSALEDHFVTGSVADVPKVVNLKDRHVVVSGCAGGASVVVSNDRRLRSEIVARRIGPLEPGLTPGTVRLRTNPLAAGHAPRPLAAIQVVQNQLLNCAVELTISGRSDFPIDVDGHQLDGIVGRELSDHGERGDRQAGGNQHSVVATSGGAESNRGSQTWWTCFVPSAGRGAGVGPSSCGVLVCCGVLGGGDFVSADGAFDDDGWGCLAGCVDLDFVVVGQVAAVTFVDDGEFVSVGG